jgi:hypothetical protein
MTKFVLNPHDQNLITLEKLNLNLELLGMHIMEQRSSMSQCLSLLHRTCI